MDNKETVTNPTTTTTVVENKTKEVRSIIFLLFAEFLGYESPLIGWAEQICSGKTANGFVERILNMEAMTIFNAMKKEYTIEEIRTWYDKFYPLVLENYDEKLEEMEKSDLPF